MQRILLVEDNEMNRDLIARRLARRGFEVLLATDGAAGVDVALRERPDLVLMDIGLPVIDGYEATRLIKANEATRDLPIIGLSAHAMSGDSDKAMAAGCDDYDTKPIEWPRLLAKIQSLLDRAAQRAAEKVVPSETPAPTEADAANTDRLLLVHDSPLHREMLAGRLSGRGWTLATAASLAEALALLDAGPFSVLLLDIGLPAENGRSALEALRAHSRGADLPVVLLSPVDQAAEAASLLGRGADELVLQPFRPEELLHRIRSVAALRGRQVGPAGGPGAAASEAADAEALALERRRTEHLANALLPAPWIEELRRERRLAPRDYEAVSVLAVDLAELGSLLERTTAAHGVGILQQLVVIAEGVGERHGLFPSGLSVGGGSGALILSAGPHTGTREPELACTRASLELLESARSLSPGLTLRLGIHRGPAMAGVVGRRAVRFGLWGPAVSIAVRIRDSGRLATFVSEAVWQHLGGQGRGEKVGDLPGDKPVAVYRIDALQA
jgi:CheY-like chemotaxis protein/class 3 adenylate cyclase